MKLLTKMLDYIDMADSIDDEFEDLEARWSNEDWDFIRSLLPSPSSPANEE